MTLTERLQKQFAELWEASPWLTTAGALLIPTLLFCLAGLTMDHRLVTGAPVWLKPAKFAISSLLYALTIAWVSGFIATRRKLLRAAGNLIATVLIVEQVLIMWQAARGTTSHFNVSTPLNASIFAVMGVSILLLWIASVAILVLLWRQPFADGSFGRALRIGMLISVIGAGMGGLMVRPTAQQLSQVKKTHTMPASGAHTVGAPDGGPGLPVTKWSTQHGDLRIPHFLGLHAIQILPLLACVLRRRAHWSEALRGRLITVFGSSYAALILLLLWQALRGQAITAPDSATAAVLAAWALTTVVAIALAGVASPQWRQTRVSGVAP